MREMTGVNVPTPFLAPRVNGFRVALEWKPQDLWIGAYWHSVRMPNDADTWHHVWICVLPMLPIHFSWHSWERSL